MAKDPAFLFYTSDFLTGTMFMNMEEKGIYITLLCVQHQHGGIIDKDNFNAVTKEHPIVRKKFIETTKGFYNKRCLEEAEKRSKYSKSRSDNRLNKKDMKKTCKTYEPHMEDEMKMKM